MSDKKEEETKKCETGGEKLGVGGKLNPNHLEEDDEFEEFQLEDWQEKDVDEEKDDVNVWEDNWDDDSVEDDFSKQLRAELEKRPPEIKRYPQP